MSLGGGGFSLGQQPSTVCGWRPLAALHSLLQSLRLVQPCTAFCAKMAHAILNSCSLITITTTAVARLHSPHIQQGPLPAAARPADEAVEKFGRHGEKVAYGDTSRFKEGVQKEGHFPGVPTTDTNAAGGHAGGAKTP